MASKPTEPSLAGALIIYGIPTCLAGNYFGNLGMVLAILGVFVARGFTNGPLFRSIRRDENPLFHGREFCEERRDERERQEGIHTPRIQQTWTQAINDFVGPAIGLPLIAVLALGVGLTVLSPRSCSSDPNYEQEYRAP